MTFRFPIGALFVLIAATGCDKPGVAVIEITCGFGLNQSAHPAILDPSLPVESNTVERPHGGGDVHQVLKVAGPIVVSPGFPWGYVDRRRTNDASVNTPVVLAGLAGEWELYRHSADEFKQRIRFEPGAVGTWHQRRETLPVSITYYVDGDELLIRHYVDRHRAFDFGVRTWIVQYALLDSNT